MATTSESNETFLQGLSDFWLRFFSDKEQLAALYQGTEIPIGQAYLDMVANVLNLSLRETPVFRKEFYKLLTIREDQVSQRTTDGYWVVEVTDYALKDFQFIQNKLFYPTAIQQKGPDFDVETSGEADYLVFFNANPFDYNGDGTDVLIPGYASRTVTVSGTELREVAFWIPDAQVDRYDLYLSYGYLLSRFEPSSEAYRALLQGIVQYFVLGPTVDFLTSAMNVIVGLPVIRDDEEVLQSVDYSDALYNLVVTDRASYQFDKEVPLREDVEDTANWGTLVFQGLEPLTTVFTVYDAVTDPTWWYDTIIPTRILPDETKTRRTINPQLYENAIGSPPGRVKIGDPGFYIGADDIGPELAEKPLKYGRRGMFGLPFLPIVPPPFPSQFFRTVASTFTTKDVGKWVRRLDTDEYYEILAYIDPQTVVFSTTVSDSGKLADWEMYESEYGHEFVPWVDPGNHSLGLKRPTYRHLFAYVVFERFLKHHTFTIVFDTALLFSGAIPFNRLDLDLQQIVLAGKSAYTTLYLEPGFQFFDEVVLGADVFTYIPKMDLSELVGAIDVNLGIGLKSWEIGDYYFYGDREPMPVTGHGLTTWSSVVDPAGANVPMEDARQLAVAGWYIPDETGPPPSNRILFYNDNQCHFLGGVRDGAPLGLPNTPHFFVDVGTSGSDHHIMAFDLTGIHEQGKPFFYMATYDAHGATDVDRIKIWINDVQRTGSVYAAPIPDVTAMTTKKFSSRAAMGGIPSGPLGWQGQCRWFWGDSTAQDNPGLPDQTEVDEMYNDGLGKQAPLTDPTGKVVYEYLFNEQVGGTVADSSGNGWTGNLPADPGWGGAVVLHGGDMSLMTIKNESSTPIGTPFQYGKTPVSIGGSDPHHLSKVMAAGTADQFGFPLIDQFQTITPTFDETDVGRWLYRLDNGEYYQIDEVHNALTVTLTRIVGDGPVAANWELYDHENGHEMTMVIDWPVQIEIS